MEYFHASIAHICLLCRPPTCSQRYHFKQTPAQRTEAQARGGTKKGQVRGPARTYRLSGRLQAKHKIKCTLVVVSPRLGLRKEGSQRRFPLGLPCGQQLKAKQVNQLKMHQIGITKVYSEV